MIGRQELLKRIRAISPASDQEEWRYLKKVIALLNIHDPETKEVLEEARKKMLI